MNKIILNCSWNPGEYSIILNWDENTAHFDSRHFHLGETTERSVDVDSETLKKFIEKISEVDFLCLSRDYLPKDGIYLEDAMTFDLLYEEGFRFSTAKWQFGIEDEDILDIEDAIAIIDPKFIDLLPIIQ